MEGRILKSKMILKGDNVNSLAEYLGIAHQTLSKKISGKADFTQSEMVKIKERYNLTDEEFATIFAKKEVS